MARKTISIEELKEYVNRFNATTADSYKDERIGKNEMLEMALHSTGNYNGFEYLSEFGIGKDAMSVGVREQKLDGTWNFDDTDHSRVRYF